MGDSQIPVSIPNPHLNVGGGKVLVDTPNLVDATGALGSELRGVGSNVEEFMEYLDSLPFASDSSSKDIPPNQVVKGILKKRLPDSIPEPPAHACGGSEGLSDHPVVDIPLGDILGLTGVECVSDSDAFLPASPGMANIGHEYLNVGGGAPRGLIIPLAHPLSLNRTWMIVFLTPGFLYSK